MNKLKLKLFGTLLFAFSLFASDFCFAQIKHGNFTLFTEQDGLPGSQVHCLIQDKFGYIWAGTINGLTQYDGYEFKRFYSNPNDSTSIKGLIVYSLFEDDEGYIWSSTSPEYLNKYNPATRSFSHYSFQQLIDHPANLELAIISMCDAHKDRNLFE
jgi:ligand-binding sensor domain-containing protein